MDGWEARLGLSKLSDRLFASNLALKCGQMIDYATIIVEVLKKKAKRK
jgi:hypothetical protein